MDGNEFESTPTGVFLRISDQHPDHFHREYPRQGSSDDHYKQHRIPHLPDHMQALMKIYGVAAVISPSVILAVRFKL